MFKLVVISAIIALAASAPGPDVFTDEDTSVSYDAPIAIYQDDDTPVIINPVKRSVGEPPLSKPSSISKQSSSSSGSGSSEHSDVKRAVDPKKEVEDDEKSSTTPEKAPLHLVKRTPVEPSSPASKDTLSKPAAPLSGFGAKSVNPDVHVNVKRASDVPAAPAKNTPAGPSTPLKVPVKN